MRPITSLCILLIFVIPTYGQFDYISVLPDLDGQDLVEQLEDDYRPSVVLPYDIARDTLFKRIYGVNDSLSCVYSGHRLYMTPGEDPTQSVYMDGAANGINTEHTWPQSYGAGSGNPRSDMHHLYPTRLQVNADRGNLPFLEIPDNQTDEWYFMANDQSSIPNSNIDLYSERSADAFEPREDHKGNVARALMYFKTIYPNAALQAPSDFFSSMQGTLCQWHSQDPVDEKEWNRNFQIATFQGGKVNPFILDCSLARRVFCPQEPVTCDPTVSNIKSVIPLTFSIYPNPNNGNFSLSITNRLEQELTISIFDMMGNMVEKIESYSVSVNSSELFNVRLSRDLTDGIYLLQLSSDKGIGWKRIFIQH